MNTIYNFFKHHSLTAAGIMYFLAFCCQLPTLISSGFISVNCEAVLSSFLLGFLTIILVNQIFHSHTAVYATAVSAILLMANWSQILLYYSCHMDYSEAINRYAAFSVLAVLSAVIVYIMLVVLNKLRNKKQFLAIIFSVFCAIISLLIFLSESNSNTSQITISGITIQPAIIMAFLMIYALSGYQSQINNSFQRALFLTDFFMMAGSLVLKKEFGIPFFCTVSFFIMYLFLSPVFELKTFGLPLGIMGTAVAVIMMINGDLSTDIKDKILGRFNVNDQATIAVNNLSVSSCFGSNSYDYFLPEVSSDYALNNNIHYFGYFWLLIFLISFTVFCIMCWFEFNRKSGTSMICNLQKLSFVFFCIVTIYNIFDNIGCFPVIGVQELWSGTRSYSIAILSGFCWGTALFDPEIRFLNFSALNNKVTELFINEEYENKEY